MRIRTNYVSTTLVLKPNFAWYPAIWSRYIIELANKALQFFKGLPADEFEFYRVSKAVSQRRDAPSIITPLRD